MPYEIDREQAHALLDAALNQVETTAMPPQIHERLMQELGEEFSREQAYALWLAIGLDWSLRKAFDTRVCYALVHPVMKHEGETDG